MKVLKIDRKKLNPLTNTHTKGNKYILQDVTLGNKRYIITHNHFNDKYRVSIQEDLKWIGFIEYNRVPNKMYEVFDKMWIYDTHPIKWKLYRFWVGLKNMLKS